MINIIVKSQCCGCSACANVCPKGCIEMQPDAEGFAYPQVNKAVCIDCGLCEKVCPILHVPSAAQDPIVYAAKIKDKVLLSKSSSGGMFTALALPILKKGGVVFGAAFDKEWNICHQYAETLEELDKLRRSKYVQSDIGKTFQQAKQFLDAGRPVFFTGTPCQIAGLKNYLGKEYTHLLTADIICHGVPSPAVWQKFIREVFPSQNITAVDFRDKSIAWDASYLSITAGDKKYPSLPVFLRPLQKIFFARHALLFRSLFAFKYHISNLYERPCCYDCKFKGLHRAADFTMGDLWGIQNIAPQLYDHRGVSVLMVNTPKGHQVFEQIKTALIYQQISLQEVAKYNPYYEKSVPVHPHREAFFARWQQEPLNRLIPRLLNQKPWPLRLLKAGAGALLRKLHLKR